MAKDSLLEGDPRDEQKRDDERDRHRQAPEPDRDWNGLKQHDLAPLPSPLENHNLKTECGLLLSVRPERE